MDAYYELGKKLAGIYDIDTLIEKIKSQGIEEEKKKVILLGFANAKNDAREIFLAAREANNEELMKIAKVGLLKDIRMATKIALYLNDTELMEMVLEEAEKREDMATVHNLKEKLREIKLKELLTQLG